MSASETDAILALVQGLESAVNRRDEPAAIDVITDDCVVELVATASAGRWQGRTAVRTAWTSLAAALTGAVIETEDVFACGDRCACRWVLHPGSSGSDRGRIRGITAFTVRGGKVARAVTYIVI
jgi:ketosteroid isomerase-like protein